MSTWIASPYFPTGGGDFFVLSPAILSISLFFSRVHQVLPPTMPFPLLHYPYSVFVTYHPQYIFLYWLHTTSFLFPSPQNFLFARGGFHFLLNSHSFPQINL